MNPRQPFPIIQDSFMQQLLRRSIETKRERTDYCQAGCRSSSDFIRTGITSLELCA